MYATLDEARAAGALGTDAEVTDALTAARRLVDAYTSRWWEPTDATIIGSVGGDGLVLLPYEVVTVTSVGPEASDLVYPASSWRFTSSSSIGGVDAVQLAPGSFADELVSGAEPWAGGYANLFGSTQRVRVVGTFGAAAPPRQVRDAAAALAAWLTQPASSFVSPPAAAVDDEGNVLSIVVEGDNPVPRARTTGLEAVDAVLQPLVRSVVRVN